ncbi:MAG: hypothetical protein EXR07_09735 [Acetobacteraceae bacterium]|nr:hypothetical protein [Acetobacteraceae bacterium]
MTRSPTVKPPGLTRDHLRRIVEVAHAGKLGFVDLVGLAELDPATAFRGAAIRGSALRGQDLAGFDFTGATFKGCDLTGADFSRATGVTEAMLAEAATDASTTLPPTLRRRRPPAWAAATGVDEFGTWADIAVPSGRGAPVIQRMRLIPAGTFWMGSPKREPGRYDDEGPRRNVTLAKAFWLFDTPCTQALWEAVMGGNPSEFKSPTRPVETVSFEEVQRFLTRVNERVPGLDLTLPSEAQWEYACRAGTKTATYAGPIEILGDANAPVLDKIAWYGGNSGRDFELDNGFDTAVWLNERQYNDPKAGTHPVKGKAPNQWGLFDMLGNVWEWCEDVWHDDHTNAPADGSARAGNSRAANRVIRGGAWDGSARDVRAASRRGRDPSFRNGNLGFRCARGHFQ